MARKTAAKPARPSRQAERQAARRAARTGAAVAGPAAADPAAQGRDARQTRLAALVMAGAMLLWMGLQWLGARQDWPPRYAYLIDFAALAAFVWSLAVAWRVWRRRQTA